MISNGTHGLVLRLGRIVALLGIVIASLVCAGVAGAADNDPGNDPPPSAGLPNLLFTAYSLTPFGTSQWEIRYTVTNRGITATPAFHVAVQQNGGGSIKDTTHASLAPGFSRQEVIHVNRTGCYFAVRLIADSTRVVRESSELDNERVVTAMTSTLCAELPRYKVKAVSFHAVDESGVDSAGSDEPYWIFNSVGADGTARTDASHVFGSIDTGSTASFAATEGCIYLSCAGGVAPFGIGFSIQLWEQDNNDLATVLQEIRKQFPKVGSLSSAVSAPAWLATATPIVGSILDVVIGLAKDDLLGSQTYAFSPDYLAAKLPTAGTSFTDTRRYEGASVILGGVYEMTTVVTRVA